jgi:hypothetical protein
MHFSCFGSHFCIDIQRLLLGSFRPRILLEFLTRSSCSLVLCLLLWWLNVVVHFKSWTVHGFSIGGFPSPRDETKTAVGRPPNRVPENAAIRSNNRRKGTIQMVK